MGDVDACNHCGALGDEVEAGWFDKLVVSEVELETHVAEILRATVRFNRLVAQVRYARNHALHLQKLTLRSIARHGRPRRTMNRGWASHQVECFQSPPQWARRVSSDAPLVPSPSVRQLGGSSMLAKWNKMSASMGVESENRVTLAAWFRTSVLDVCLRPGRLSLRDARSHPSVQTRLSVPDRAPPPPPLGHQFGSAFCRQPERIPSSYRAQATTVRSRLVSPIQCQSSYQHQLQFSQFVMGLPAQWDNDSERLRSDRELPESPIGVVFEADYEGSRALLLELSLSLTQGQDPRNLGGC